MQATTPQTANPIAGITMLPNDSSQPNHSNVAEPRGIDLSRDALLVKLTIGQFSPKRNSKIVQQEAAERHGANPESLEGRARIIQKDTISAITNAVSKARTTFYFYTIPWDDSGYRLLPSKFYDKLMRVLKEAEGEFFHAVSEMSQKRDAMAEAARRDLTDDIFNEVGFPTEQELHDAYRFAIDQMPLANPKDIRLAHVSQDQLAAIQGGLQARIEAKVNGAMGEIVERLIALVGNVHDQCDKDNPRIYDTLIGNIRKAVEVLPALNVGDDPEINRLINRVDKELSTIETDDLRADEDARKATARKAMSILDELKNFGSK